MSMIRNEEKLIGEIFGKLKVVSFNGEKTILGGKARSYWDCKCECGNKITVREDGLINRQDTSCGCENINKIKECLLNNGYLLLDRYRVNKTTRVIIQDNFGYKYDILQAAALNKNHNISPFHNGNSYTLENISLWLKINNKKFELCKDNTYTDNKKHLSFHCFICNENFNMAWKHTIGHHGCGVCNGKQVVYKTSLAYLRPDIAKEFLSSKNNFLADELSEFSGESVLWKCFDCRYEWYASVNSRTNNNTGCPKCNESKGENKIGKFLLEKNIIFKQEYMFDDCKGLKRKLPFDFYLLNYGILIEYHGIQHYKSLDYFGGDDNFKERQRLDKIKSEYCSNNNIPLLIIPYWEFDNIESILTQYLNLQ